MEEFVTWPSIPRLNRDMVITEKIDGSNAQVYITETVDPDDFVISTLVEDGTTYFLLAGSRNRWLTPFKGEDNHGFAQWCSAHASDLFALGPGRHYGEWYGQGIQRGYGLKQKRFALFNVHRWGPDRDMAKYSAPPPKCCEVVPVLYAGPFDTAVIQRTLADLKRFGSAAEPTWMQPEGLVVFHTAAGQAFKITLDGDAKHAQS